MTIEIKANLHGSGHLARSQSGKIVALIARPETDNPYHIHWIAKTVLGYVSVTFANDWSDVEKQLNNFGGDCDLSDVFF